MVHYKLTYFNARGFGEVSRQLFVLAGVEYEDVRFEHGDGTWEKLKPNTPLGQVPVLSVDGFEIPQSAAIARYLARKFGYAGKTAEEEAWVDAIVDQFKDFIAVFRQIWAARRLGKSEEEVARICKEVADPARDSYFEVLNKILSKSKSGFLVGDSLTWADLVVADNLTTLEKNQFYNPADQPKLVEYHNKITSIPALKTWIEKRPDTLL